MHTLEQDFAQKVYAKVDCFGREHAEDSPERKQYGAMAHKLPVMVRQAGLVQALEFVNSRGKPAQHDLLKDLAEVVAGQPAERFVDDCRRADLASYMWLTRRTLVALEWFKRFAQSVLEIEPGGDGES